MAFQALEDEVALAREAGERSEMLVYYSGHSTEHGLVPGGDIFPYRSLRDRLEDIEAEVRVTILDSCASGALLRAKGGMLQPALRLDLANDITGEAFLTSSSADEASQESDRLGGSFFTPHLVTGLRGAADADGDRRVTLQEAYAFAFDATLARTEQTRLGPQHPSYEIDLTGHGALVLTDLTGTDARLSLDSALDGWLSIRDDDGHLVLEADKRAGTPLELALERAPYTLQLRAGPEATWTARVSLADGPVHVDHDSLQAVEVMALHTARGDLPEDPARTVTVPAHLTVLHRLSTTGTTPAAVRGFSLNLLQGTHASVSGVELGWVNVISGAQNGLEFGAVNVIGGPARGLQAAAVNIVTGPHAGAQAGLINVAAGGSTGGQIGIVNVLGGHQRGFQLGAVTNYSDDLRGAQVSLVNVARRVRGFQLGLVNIAAQLDGEALGLVNFVGNGYHAFEAWSSDMAPLHLGLKSGSKHIYSLFTVGIDPFVEQQAVQAGFGLGVHVPGRRVSVDVDLLTSSYEAPLTDLWRSGPPGIVGSLRIGLNLEFTDHFGLMLGSGVHTAYLWRAAPDPTVMPVARLAGDGESEVLLWPGLAGGVRVRF